MDFDKFGIERLTATNYGTWSTKMEFYLKLKGIHDALIDDTAKGSDQALGAIALSIDNSILPLITGVASAKEAWEKLAQIYKTKNTASIIRLKNELNTLKKGHTESITAYAGRAYTLKDNLASAGAKVEDMDLALAMLNGLPSEYATLKSIVENMEPFPSLDSIITKLMTEEARHPPSQETAYFAPKSKSGFWSPFGGNKPSFEKRCHYCKEPGHFIGKCSKRLAAENRKRNNVASSYFTREVAWSAITTNNGAFDNGRTWFLDSGSERHITNEEKDLINPTPSSAKIIVGSGKVLTATLEGDVALLVSESKIRRLVLRRVLYIPGFATKLISVKKCKLAGASFDMTADKCIIKMDGDTIIEAKDGPNGIPCIVSDATSAEPSLALVAKIKNDNVAFDKPKVLAMSCVDTPVEPSDVCNIPEKSPDSGDTTFSPPATLVKPTSKETNTPPTSLIDSSTREKDGSTSDTTKLTDLVANNTWELASSPSSGVKVNSVSRFNLAEFKPCEIPMGLATKLTKGEG